MAKKKIFVSYDYDNDRNYKNLLLGWSFHPDIEFSMNDRSADVSIQSYSAVVIKRAISAKINDATYFLILVGKDTWKSSWCKWEIEKAIELRKKIIAVKLNNTNTTPTALYGIGAKWAMSFTLHGISKAIEEA